MVSQTLLVPIGPRLVAVTQWTGKIGREVEQFVMIWWHVMSWPVLLPKAMSGSAALLQLGSVLMSHGHADVHDLGSNQRPCWYQRVMLPYWSEWSVVTLRPTGQASTMPESVAVLQPGSMLMSVIHVINGSHWRAGPAGLGTRELVPPPLASAVEELPPSPQKTHPSDTGMGELASVFEGQNCPSTFMATKVRELTLKAEKLVPSLPVHTPKICPQRRGHRRSVSDPCLKGVVLMKAWTDQFSYYPGTRPGLWVDTH